LSDHRYEFTMRPPTFLQRVGHWQTGRKPPRLEGPAPVQGFDWARLVPYAYREFHEAYARAHGLYWLPCVLCGHPYGGHEGGGSVPDPTAEGLPAGATMWITICSRCTHRGLAQD
jgi:hypothetical protein